MTNLCDTCTMRDQGCVIDPLGTVANCTVYRQKDDLIMTTPNEPNRGLTEEHLRRTVELQAARIKELERRVIDLDQKLHGRPGRL